MDESKLQEFMMKALGDMGATATAPMILLGDRLGLYKTLAEIGPANSTELAKKTGTAERYIREWLSSQAAAGYVTYDVQSERYFLNDEQKITLAEEDSPFFIPGAFQCMAAMFAAHDKLAECFKSGKGLDWGEQHPLLFVGTERFFRPGYLAHLISEWIPSLEGVEAKLKSGSKMADIGCGHGASTILLAKAFPNSRFFGFDYHRPSIEKAQERARAAGLSDRVKFEVAKATDFPGEGYDLVAHFDCLHDMGDPVGAARRVRETLAPDGTWMVVEPRAGDKPEDNYNLIGRVFYAASTSVCVPASLAQDGPALGAQAGEAKLRKVLEAGGFSRIRRSAETPFNMVLEAKA
ncbi:MAG: methyltransferase domain-containing protein [Deltaproteobacteria bacterium]|nr:methyltransferase domain-containing protein [Deltaproteobacteria bacterium]